MPAIYGSMAAVMAELEAIGKDRRNKDQGFNFRGIDQAYNALHPIMAKHKVFSIPRVLKMTARVDRPTRSGGNITFTLLEVEYDFVSGIDGSRVTAGPVIGEGADTGDKGCSKALAIAHKYVLMQTFLIPTEKTDDPDFESHDVVYEAPPTRPPATQPPPANKSGSIEISDPAEATTVADLIINLADGQETVEGLKDYWVKNIDRINYMKEFYPVEYNRITAAIAARKATLQEQHNDE
jgi:hypothetical protein